MWVGVFKTARGRQALCVWRPTGEATTGGRRATARRSKTSAADCNGLHVPSPEPPVVHQRGRAAASCSMPPAPPVRAHPSRGGHLGCRGAAGRAGSVFQVPSLCCSWWQHGQGWAAGTFVTQYMDIDGPLEGGSRRKEEGGSPGACTAWLHKGQKPRCWPAESRPPCQGSNCRSGRGGTASQVEARQATPKTRALHQGLGGPSPCKGSRLWQGRRWGCLSIPE
jgi:hypothetical protein